MKFLECEATQLVGHQAKELTVLRENITLSKGPKMPEKSNKSLSRKKTLIREIEGPCKDSYAQIHEAFIRS